LPLSKAEYMRDYNKNKRGKKRICPCCGSRELEYHKKLCSECVEINDRLSKDIAQHTWLKKRKGGK